MIVYAITLKYMTRDANDLPDYVWATKSQVDTIVRLRNNPDKRYNFIRLGRWIFSPMDIVKIEEKNTDYCGEPIPAYVRNRYLEEQQRQGLASENEIKLL